MRADYRNRSRKRAYADQRLVLLPLVQPECLGASSRIEEITALIAARALGTTGDREPDRAETLGGWGEIVARGPSRRVDEWRLILVVEDDDPTRAFLLDNLAADGFRVAGASGAGEGLRAIEVRQPALVVLDLGLEDGSGLALLDRVRAADGLASRIDPDLPVIVLSGRAGDADRVRSFARGADDHVCKPTCRFPQRGVRLVERAALDDCARPPG